MEQKYAAQRQSLKMKQQANHLPLIIVIAIVFSCTVIMLLCMSYSKASAKDLSEDDSSSNGITITSLLLQAETALKENNIDGAIECARRGIAKDNDDIDLHKIYALSLEKKLLQQGNSPEPALFNRCVKEWLVVLRNQAGDEKGLSCRGVSFPLIDRCFEDEDRTLLARQHLLELTGTVPKLLETNRKYLLRVLKPVPGS